jgi:hypothetical protein
VARIHGVVFERSKFLGSFVESVSRWERDKNHLTLWFTPENRALVDMLDRKQSAQLEKTISQVLGESVKVTAKVGGTDPAPQPDRPAAPAKGPRDGVQALLDRFGGTLRTGSDVPAPQGRKRRE